MTVRAEVRAEIPFRAAPYETPPSGSNPTDSCTARNDAAPEGGAAVHVQAPPDETVALHDGAVDALRCTCTRKPGVPDPEKRTVRSALTSELASEGAAGMRT